MAKIKPTNIKISGKIGTDVFVDSKVYGHHLRKSPAAGLKRNEPALKQQHSRTKYLNDIASEINKIISECSGNLRSGDFYSRLQSRLRKEPVDNRFLLLLQLKGMEINKKYPLSNLGRFNIVVEAVKNKITATLRVESDPEAGKHSANCYYYEIVFVSWQKNKKAATVTRVFSDWILMESRRPIFEFPFAKHAQTNHWFLAIRQRLGINRKVIGTMATDGMQISEAGTFDKSEKALLEKRNSEPAFKEQVIPVENLNADILIVKAKITG